jgi:hypothetical protein
VQIEQLCASCAGEGVAGSLCQSTDCTVLFARYRAVDNLDRASAHFEALGDG